MRSCAKLFVERHIPVLRIITWLSRTASLLANTPSHSLHLLLKRAVKSVKTRVSSIGWFIHLWPTAKKDSGEPDTKEGQCLDSTISLHAFIFIMGLMITMVLMM